MLLLDNFTGETGGFVVGANAIKIGADIETDVIFAVIEGKAEGAGKDLARKHVGFGIKGFAAER